MPLKDYLEDHYGDIAGIIGLTFTAWAAFSARKSKRESRKLREALQLTETIANLSIVITKMEAITMFYPYEHWSEIANLCADCKSKLIITKTDNLILDETQVIKLNDSISFLNALEGKINQFLNDESLALQITSIYLKAGMNKRIDEMREISTSLQQKIGD